jgi:hypothetical protein
MKMALLHVCVYNRSHNRMAGKFKNLNNSKDDIYVEWGVRSSISF